MSFNVDVVIFAAFLTCNLIFGLLSGRGITTIRGYAVGNKDFSTATLVATIVATWVSGQFFFSIISETYTQGFRFIWTCAGDFLCLLIIGVICAPRMAEFLGKLSIAEAMGNLYGKNVRIITAISGFIGVIGIIAIQLKIAGLIFEHALGIPGSYGVISAGIVVTLYSSLGGIKSVTFTDVVQFGTFGVVIPTLAYFLLTSLENDQIIIDTLTNNPLFDYNSVFDLSNPETYYYFSLFLFFILPSFNPAIFQRIAMARNIKQVRYSFIIASIVCLLLTAAVNWIGVLAIALYPNIDENDIFKIIISDSSWIVGFRGVILAGVMAMVLSTVDSYINSSAVLLIHDLRKSLGIRFIKSELFTTRICSLLIGSVSIMFAMSNGSFLQLFIWANMFYMPIVTVPFILAIFGFRSTGKVVLIGMGAGFCTAIIWELFLKTGDIDGLIPAIFANLVCLLSSHYLLKQKGGWVGIKNPIPLIELREERKQRFKKLLQEIGSFDPIKLCKKNTPKGEGFIALLGLFIMISTFSSINLLPKEIQMNKAFLLDVLYPFTLCISTALISYPLWLQQWKETVFLPIFWNIIMFFVLICFSFFTVLISNFSDMQLIVFMVNIVVISSLINWRWTLFFLVSGVTFTLFFYENYFVPIQIQRDVSSLEFKIVYLLLLLTGASIMFLKPKQEYLEATEQEAEHLKYEVKGLEKEVGFVKRELENVVQGLEFLENQFKDKEGKLKTKEIYLKDQLKLRNIEIAKLKDLKDEFIRNLSHEANTPMTGILSLSEVLYSCYDSLDEKVVKQSIKDIVSSSDRLKSFVSNISDLSKLSALTYELDKTAVDLSELARERPMLYKKIFADDDKQRFIFKVEDNIIVDCDEYYITQAIDSLISNAVKYGEGKPIIVSLARTEDNKVQFTITDEGIGIPKDELISIFHKFTVSSKTRTPAGGRGVGLALCEKVIAVHGGRVEAKSDGKKGSSFSFVLPL